MPRGNPSPKLAITVDPDIHQNILAAGVGRTQGPFGAGRCSLVPAPVLARVSRSPQQAQLRRFLARCVVVPLGEAGAHEAGRLLGMTKTADVVDAVVVTTALHQKATILTSDPDDIERLVRASGHEVAVVAI